MLVTTQRRNVVVAVVIALFANACKGDSGAPGPLPDALRGVTVSPSAGSVIVGQTISLTASADAAATSVSVTTTFTSGTPTVATVSASGVVTGVSVGTAVVIVSSTGSGSGFTSTSKTARATITVLPAPDAIRSVTVSPSVGDVTVGRTLSLTSTADAAAASVAVTYAFASGTPAVATVSTTGVVSGVSPGTAVITVTATGSGTGYTTTSKSATATITVAPAPDALRGLTLSPSTGTVTAGQTLSLSPVPDVAAANVNVTSSYASSAPTVATVSAAGVVTGLTAGSALITVTATGSAAGFTTNSRTATATITVLAGPNALSGLTLSPATANVIIGSTFAFVATPDVAAPTVSVSNVYSSSNTLVATVSSTGVVTGVTLGTSVITLTATGSGFGYTTTSRTATATITVGLPIFAADQFVPIPAGSFLMGTATGVEIDERPQHTVTLSAFAIQKTELTQAQWRAVTGLNPSFNQACGVSCPMESVSFDEVQAFIVRLNQLDPGKGYRLPTEAQWEYASRAGTASDLPGNGIIEEVAWWQGNSGDRTKPGAQKRANNFGLYDTIGNVWEMVQDWYSSTYYAISPPTDPAGPQSGSARVIRGGSALNPASSQRSAYRNTINPSQPASFVGFRLVRNP